MERFVWQGRCLPVISLIGENLTDRLQQSPKRILADFVFYLVTEGELFLSENGKEYRLCEGDCMLLEPELLQFGIRPSHYHILYAHFSLSDFKKLSGEEAEMDSKGKARIPKLLSLGNSPAYHRLKGLLEQAVREKSSPLSGSCRFSLFLAEFSREAELLDSGKLRQTDHGKALANRVFCYLRENYHRNLTGELLEKELSYNFDYLNQIFKLHFSTTVFRMLADLRMENAINLLLNSDCSVKEIADETGYRDESYFSKVFKKINGLTPVQFRKQGTKPPSS